MARRTQADRSMETRAQLILAAKTLLGEKGYSQATTADIARLAGVTTGALHHHFPTKEALFFAVLDDATELSVACFRDLAEAEGDRSLTFERLIRSLWTLYGSPSYWAVWEINIHYRADPAMHRKIARHRKMTVERLLGVITANRKLRPATRHVLLEMHPFILATMRGMCLDTLLYRDAAMQEEQLSLLAALMHQEAERRRRPAPERRLRERQP